MLMNSMKKVIVGPLSMLLIVGLFSCSSTQSYKSVPISVATPSLNIDPDQYELLGEVTGKSEVIWPLNKSSVALSLAKSKALGDASRTSINADLLIMPTYEVTEEEFVKVIFNKYIVPFPVLPAMYVKYNVTCKAIAARLNR